MNDMEDFKRDSIKEKIDRILWLKKLLNDELEFSSVVEFTPDYSDRDKLTMYGLESFDMVAEAYGIGNEYITTEVVSGGHFKKYMRVKGIEVNVYALKGSDDYDAIKRAL
jgi:hypothetical protein